jgi:hypothetical protein
LQAAAATQGGGDRNASARGEGDHPFGVAAGDDLGLGAGDSQPVAVTPAQRNGDLWSATRPERSMRPAPYSTPGGSTAYEIAAASGIGRPAAPSVSMPPAGPAAASLLVGAQGGLPRGEAAVTASLIAPVIPPAGASAVLADWEIPPG